MTYLQPVFSHAGLTVTVVGVLREEGAAHIAYCIEVARDYYRLRRVTLHLQHARLTRRGMRQLRAAIIAAKHAEVEVTLHANASLEAALTDAVAVSHPAGQRAPIGFERRPK